MVSARRVVAVTLGLIGAGAIFGALAGGIALSISLLITENDTSGSGLVIGAFFGAPLGAIAAPTAAWLLLRRVPLGRVFAGSVAGTVLGGVVGWVLPFAGDQVGNGLFGAVAGFAFATVWMWSRTLVRAAPQK
jgi:hypothetical protein